MNEKKITYPQQDRWAYLWLLIGTLLGFCLAGAVGLVAVARVSSALYALAKSFGAVSSSSGWRVS